ncbi:MAG: NAD(P)-dependent oxidoreductase [Anaerolineae bacterium]
MVTKSKDKLDRKARLQLPPVHAQERDPQVRIRDFGEILILHTPEAAIAEASRCLQCANAPCQKACPLHNDIPRALSLLAEGEISAAADVYRETSTLPEFCGRLCPERFCYNACALGKLGKPIDTRRLEAFVTTHQRRTEGYPDVHVAPPTGKRVALIGAGPASLTVAEILARRGHEVVIYEREPVPGGLLIYGIPRFKLATEVVEAKIDWLKGLGVTFRCNTEVGKDVAFEQLKAEYDAVFIGAGAKTDYRPGLPGEDLTGVIEATEFLCRGNLPTEILPPAWRTPMEIGPRVHVLGGGNTAMDCLRTALRLPGVEEVTCYYRRSEAEMPCCHEEYRHAKEEGADFVWQVSPVAFLGDEAGHLCAVRYQHMELGAPDASGRRRPVPIPGSAFTVEADTVILAFGYRPERAFVEHLGLETEPWGTLKVDDEAHGRTSEPGVFAAGDIVRGADLLAPAIADARHVAESMDAYLCTKKD